MNDVYKNLEFDEIINQIKALCAFSLGESLIENIKPSNNHLLVEQRLTLTKEVMELINLAEEYTIENVSDMTFEVEKAQKDMLLVGNELIKIANINLATKTIINKVKNSEVEVKNLVDLVNTLTLLDELEKTIRKSINPYGEVLVNASATLKQLHSDLDTLNQRFDNSVKRFIEKHSNILSDTLEYERNNRKVVLINSNYKNRVAGVIHGESKSGQSLYFEPNNFISFNNERSSLAHLIKEEEEKILFQLSQMVKGKALIINNNLNILAELDALLAIAKWGYAREAVIAELSDDQSIYLENAAHPLIDKKQVVRNTYQISDQATLIVSGPNTGGKTVTLKTIGLSILMSMCGIPIIADYGKVPIVDNIFIDLGDAQSVVAALSTFSSHLTKLANIINNVTKNSLVMLDELGSGTDPKEGEAFAIAILEYLKAKSTITLVTTHLSGLKNYAQSHADITLASVEFDEKTLSPTYRYIEGLAGQSNALEIAKKFDFPDTIMARAQQLKSSMQSDEEKLMATLETKERQLRLNEERLNKELADFKQREKAFKTKVAENKATAENYLNEAKIQANKYLLAKEQEIDELYAEMLQLHKTVNLEKASEIKAQLKSQTETVRPSVPDQHEFKVGDNVRVAGLNHLGEITSIDNNNVMVSVNNMNIKTKLAKLTYIGAKKATPQKRKVRYEGPKRAKMELNLIGKNVYDSTFEVDKFIDNAILANLNSVTIVHGVGSGKLRAGIVEHLKKHNNVKSFETAPQASGGLGATIVYLK